MAVRQDVRKLGSDWHPILEWYARAVRELSTRKIGQRTSWAYLGAIHGLDVAGWVQAGIVSAGDPLPSQSERGRLWNQCQHNSWFFLPWHRGYLAAFEAIVAKAVQDLGGPNDWALPYWNYLDATEPLVRDIPKAFTDPTMPDGSPNALAKPHRAAIKLGPTPWFPRDIDLSAMAEKHFTAASGALGFGGGATRFNHLGGPAATGAMEGNPHNRVHVMIGGVGANAGYMSDPDYAALDPIFWLHHCNVDRLWAAWMAKPGSNQENGAQFMAGPAPRQFEMPDALGNLAVFTPAQLLPGGPLEPTYDTLAVGTGVAVVAQGGQGMPAGVSPPPPDAVPMGANDAPVSVSTSSTTLVQLAPAETIVAAPAPQRVLLNLENVRGTAPSGVLNVYLSLPASLGLPASVPEVVDTVSLFGLGKASREDGEHGGNGLTVALDITDLVRSLRAGVDGDLDQLQVRLEQPQGAELPPITVERVSVYRQDL
jgi:tyrosinase